MKVWEFQHPGWGIVFKRISKALHENSPADVEWVDSPEKADINFIHVVGPGEEKYLKELDNLVIFQHCYFTASPQEIPYDSYWQKSILSMSFHDLRDYTDKEFNFFRTPLGANPKVFYITDLDHERNTKVFTTGHVAPTESLDKIFEACKRTGNMMYHTGHNFKWSPGNYTWLNYMHDDALRAVLNNTQYVAGLRDIEGFEVMCVEGLFCGARPIVPDLNTYSFFYKDFGELLDMDRDIVEQLIAIFDKQPKPITKDEMSVILNKFSWQNIVNNIFQAINRVMRDG